MKRNLIALLLALALSLSLSVGVFAAENGDITVTLNGAPLSFNDFAPEIDAESGRTFLPLRQTFEALGCASEDIVWDAETQTAAAKRLGVTVSLTLGNTDATVTEGGETRTETMDAAPYMKTDENGGGYVYVPLRFAAQALGCAVDWDAETRTVILTDDTLPAPEREPDAKGTVSFENLASRMRSGNLTVLMAQEGIDAAEDVDYEKAERDLRDALNEIANQQWSMMQIPGLGSMMSASMQTQYDAVKENFDAIRKGDTQKDAEARVREMKDAQDQLIFASESMYIQLNALEAQRASAERQLAALDRKIAELELRHDLGQVSDLQLLQLKTSRASAASGIATLETGIRAMKLSLESMLNEELTGEIVLTPLPAVTARQIGAMDPEKDFAAAQAVSYTLYSAKRTLDDAEKAFKDAGKDYNYNTRNENYRRAEHTWQAAQYKYQSTVQQFELSFRLLYNQVKNNYQVWEASCAALESQKAAYAAEELKYRLGTISQNALLTAQDELEAAQEAVDSAANTLFSDYNSYRWAVDYGILN